MAIPWPPPGTVPLALDVVSVQSQVVYGRVGNNVALPTLAAFGLTAAAVPTVLLSNTPHYATLHGGATPIDWFTGFLDDLEARGALAGLRAVATGYLGSPAQADALARWISARLADNPELCVVVDPVIGDHAQGVYVDPGLVAAYREALLPLASVLTPNDFELARLTGRPVDDVSATVGAARTLLVGRTQWVAVTSAAPATWPAGRMRVALVARTGAWLIEHPRIAAEPKGTGDLFSASLTAGLVHGEDSVTAARDACARVVAALRLTTQARCAELLLADARAMVPPDGVVVREWAPSPSGAHAGT
jgi:pyridoxine kinase